MCALVCAYVHAYVLAWVPVCCSETAQLEQHQQPGGSSLGAAERIHLPFEAHMGGKRVVTRFGKMCYLDVLILILIIRLLQGTKLNMGTNFYRFTAEDFPILNLAIRCREYWELKLFGVEQL